MALDGVLANIPGLAGYAAMQDFQQRQSLGGLQGAMGVLQALRQHDESLREAQMAPLRMQALQAQVQQAQGLAEERQRDAALQSSLPAIFQQATGPDGNIDYNKVSGTLMQTPGGLKTGMDLRKAEEDRLARVQQAESMIEQRRLAATQQHEALMQRLQDSRQRAAEMERHNRVMEGLSAQTRALAQMTASQGGRPPPGYRWTPNGDQEVIPGGPADVKAQAAAQRQADGATDVDVALSQLRDAYDRLEKGGGITSTKSGVLGNIAAAASSSPVGQSVGKYLGTDNQSARNEIAMARPALLASIMKATGMSAKQMDSNAELKLWLSTATDPTLDVEANRKALKNIEDRFLKKGPSSTPAKQVKRTGMLNGKRVVEYTDGTIEVQ